MDLNEISEILIDDTLDGRRFLFMKKKLIKLKHYVDYYGWVYSFRKITTPD